MHTWKNKKKKSKKREGGERVDRKENQGEGKMRPEDRQTEWFRRSSQLG